MPKTVHKNQPLLWCFLLKIHHGDVVGSGGGVFWFSVTLIVLQYLPSSSLGLFSPMRGLINLMLLRVVLRLFSCLLWVGTILFFDKRVLILCSKCVVVEKKVDEKCRLKIK